MVGIWVMLFAAALGGLVQSAAGFGSALVAIPLFMQVVEATTATPVQALLSLVISVIVLWRNWQALDFAHARNLILASMPGIPIGIYLLKTLPERWIFLALGVLLVGYSCWSWVMSGGRSSRTGRTVIPAAAMASWGAWLTGFTSGMLGGAYNTSGPPLVIYSSLKGWAPEQFKSVLSAFFVCEGLLLIIFHSLIGTMTSEVLGYFARLFPAMLLGVVAGHWIAAKVSRETFGKAVLILLFILGVRMLTLV